MAETEEDLDLDVNEEGGGDKGKKKKKAGSGKLLIILLGAGVGILVIALAVVLTIMLTSGGGSKSKDKGGDQAEQAAEGGDAQGEAPAEGEGGANKAAVFYADLEGPFTVNFEDDTTIRFLQVEVKVMVKEEKALEVITQHLPIIRNNLVLLFSGQDYAVIISREGKEELRAQAKAEVQKVVEKYYGKPAVEDVYFISFVIQ